MQDWHPSWNDVSLKWFHWEIKKSGVSPPISFHTGTNPPEQNPETQAPDLHTAVITAQETDIRLYDLHTATPDHQQWH